MIFALSLTSALAADLDLPAASLHASVSQTVGTVNISVDYSSPGVKGRTIWGELVPYDKLWRTGANGATTIELDGDAMIGGQKVEAGRYAVFSEPGEETWTVILNSNPDQGGTGSYDKELDVARFEAKPVKIEGRERLTFLFVDSDEDSSTLHLEWAGVAVPMPIEIASADRANKSIEGYVKSSARQLANAARFKSEQGMQDEAMALVEKSLAVQETWFATWISANVYKEQGNMKGAQKALKATMKLGERDGGFFYKSRVEEALKSWPKK